MHKALSLLVGPNLWQVVRILAYVIDFAYSQAKKLLRQKDVDDEMAALVYQMKVSKLVNGKVILSVLQTTFH